MKRVFPERDLDPGLCLGSTHFIDSGQPRIQETIRRLELKALSPRERAKRLSTFVRDEIAYEFAIRFTPEEYVASQILQEGKGFCVRKAIVLCARGRAAEIPTAVVLCDLRDFTLSSEVKAALRTDVMYHHGLSALHVDGTWVLVDASLTPELDQRKGYRLVEFDGSRDALLPETTLNGSPHVKYVTFHGLYADLPYEQMMEAFQRGYASVDRAKIRKLGFPP